MEYIVNNFTEKKSTPFIVDNPFTGHLAKAFDEFHQYYSPVLIATHPKQKLRMPAYIGRQCRFCYKFYPEVTFEKEAHIIPKLTGNRYLIHDCECDACNEQFGHYDDSFAKSLGMMRTADALRGRKGIPGFKSADEKLIMKYTQAENGQHFIDILDHHGGPNKVGDNQIKLDAVKQTYIPLHIMKSLYKIGYSFLNASELQNYAPTLRIIMSNEFDNKLGNFAQVAKITLPNRLNAPFVVIYRKKTEYTALHMPTEIVMLHFGRYVYQYFLLTANDRFLFKAGEKCNVMFLPTPFEGATNDNFTMEKLDLSSPEKKIGEEHSVILTFDPK